MSSLYEIVKIKMDMFDVSMPFAIKEIKLDANGNFPDGVEESVYVEDGHITFKLSVDQSFVAISELVAKAKLAQEHGSLMCTQKFTTKQSRDSRRTFFSVISPLANAYAFQVMHDYLPKQAFLKEKMEWEGYYRTISEMDDDESVRSLLLSLYLTLQGNKIIDEKVPVMLHPYKKAITVYLELFDDGPSPIQLSRAVNNIIGDQYYCALDQKDGEEMFLLREVKLGDYIDQAIA